MVYITGKESTVNKGIHKRTQKTYSGKMSMYPEVDSSTRGAVRRKASKKGGAKLRKILNVELRKLDLIL